DDDVDKWAAFKAVAAFLAHVARGSPEANGRLAAVALALRGRMVAELGALSAVASFLSRDHSQQTFAFALAPSEETSLLLAFCEWVTVHDPKQPQDPSSGQWQETLPSLLARNSDSAERVAALAGAAAAAMDVQALFDGDRSACVEQVAQQMAAALERHAGCESVVTPAAAFLARVDRSAVLHDRRLCLAAATLAARDLGHRVPALRALLRVADVAEAVRVRDLLDLASEPALDAALHAVLWRAVAASNVQGLLDDRDALLAACEELVVGSAADRSTELRDLAFVALGRVLRVFTGPLARTHPTLAIDAPAAARIRQLLYKYFDERMAAPPRSCALAAAWVSWLGDQTLPPSALSRLA
ncbi:hypothetical protein IWW38_006092, partial [Coemansia aciculifera]